MSGWGGLTRRAALAAAGGVLAGCRSEPTVTGSFTGASHDRGHRLRDPASWPAPSRRNRTRVLVLGGGIAGLAATRALRQRGIEDFAVLELESEAGGNSRGGRIGGIDCPLGAHYLPVPTDDAPEVQQLLEELGLRRREAGRWVHDERHRVHAPQERLYFRGQWQEGLLPVAEVGPATLAQYGRFARRVAAQGRAARFTMPRRPGAPAAAHLALDALTMRAWLDREGLDDAHLRWYLDYCCRDDYGAGLDTVSAWAGLHYFAARHGFQAPGEGDGDGAYEAPFTWPEGNARLARALAQPLADRFHGGQLVLRVAEGRHAVEVDALGPDGGVTRWQAAQCIVALPVFVAARIVEGAPAALTQRAARTRHAPWLVANLHLKAPPDAPRGMPPAWDNVLYGSTGLGYVVATHQALDPTPGPTVLTWYAAPGEAARAALLQRPWTAWRDAIVAELSVPHPDLPAKLTRIDVARYGHAMAIPAPGTLRLPAAPQTARLRFAHADWAGYSVFEEAFTLGHRAGATLRP